MTRCCSPRRRRRRRFAGWWTVFESLASHTLRYFVWEASSLFFSTSSAFFCLTCRFSSSLDSSPHQEVMLSFSWQQKVKAGCKSNHVLLGITISSSWFQRNPGEEQVWHKTQKRYREKKRADDEEDDDVWNHSQAGKEGRRRWQKENQGSHLLSLSLSLFSRLPFDPR